MRSNLILWSLRHSLARNDCSIIWQTRHTCCHPTWEPYHGLWTCLHGYSGVMKCLTVMACYQKNAGSVCLHKGLWISVEGTADCTLCCKTCWGSLQERRLLGHDEQEVQAIYHHSCLGKCTFPIGTCRYQDAWILQQRRSTSHWQHECQHIIRYHRIYFWYLQEQEVTEQTVRCNVFCPDDNVVLKSRKRIRYKNN